MRLGFRCDRTVASKADAGLPGIEHLQEPASSSSQPGYDGGHGTVDVAIDDEEVRLSFIVLCK